MSSKLIAGAAGSLLLAAMVIAGLGTAQAQDREKAGHAAAPARAQNVQRSRPQAAQRAPQRAERAARPQRVQRAEPRQRPKTTTRQVERKRAEPKRQATTPRKETPNRAAERQKQERNSAAARQKAEPNSQARARASERGEGQQVNHVQATTEQRVHVRDEIFKTRGLDRVSRKDFGVDVRIGNHVNQRHRRHLHRLTPALIAFAPFYSDYSYIVVDDDICFVDPQTYAIVDIIPSSLQYVEGSSQRRPQLALSAADMHFIYASVPRDQMADVRVRLALGAEVPGAVDLQRFPDAVIERVPQIESYRFIVVESDVVVVDPSDRQVALVVTE